MKFIKTDGKSPRYTYDPNGESRVKIPEELWGTDSHHAMQSLACCLEDFFRGSKYGKALRGILFHEDGKTYANLFTNVDMDNKTPTFHFYMQEGELKTV